MPRGAVTFAEVQLQQIADSLVEIRDLLQQDSAPAERSTAKKGATTKSAAKKPAAKKSRSKPTEVRGT